MADPIDAAARRKAFTRSVRQHLESLERAGLDRIASPTTGVSVSPRGARRGAAEPAAMSAPDHPIAEPARPIAPAAPPHPLAAALVPETPKPVALAPRGAKASRVPPPTTVSLFGSTGFDTPPVPPEDRPAILEVLAAEVAGCQKCPHLAAARNRTVFGSGSNVARLMFVGEAPGADEDRTGLPFVGRAGQLLTDMITKGMGLTRDQVYIANILKCRPPENRQPTSEECANCLGYLDQQISIVRPDFLCLLGLTAASRLLETTLSMGMLRGKWHRYRGILTLVTYHPSYLLRTPSAKKDAWADLQILMKEMGLPVNRSKP